MVSVSRYISQQTISGRLTDNQVVRNLECRGHVEYLWRHDVTRNYHTYSTRQPKFTWTPWNEISTDQYCVYAHAYVRGSQWLVLPMNHRTSCDCLI